MKIKRMAWCMIFAICTVSLPRSEYAKIKTGEEEITCMEQDAEIVEVSDLDALAEAVAEQTKEDGKEALKKENLWGNKRLLVKSEEDFDVMGAESMIQGYDNLYILNYASEQETKAAYQSLKKKKNLVVEADGVYEAAATEQAGESKKKGDLSFIVSDAGKPSDETNVLVAVIDTGYDINWYGQERIVDARDLTDSGTIQDENGHGTEMANNILQNTEKEVCVMPIKAADDNGRTSSLKIYMGIRYAVEHHANIINISMCAYKSSGSHVLREAICEARRAGIMVVVSAGNAKGNVVDFSPSDVEEAVVVTAVSADEALAEYSNYGFGVDYCAYGSSEVLGLNGRRVKQKGTSVAASTVSAVAARQKAMHRNCSYEEWIGLLDACAKDLGEAGEDVYYGRGLLLTEPQKPNNDEDRKEELQEEENVSLLNCDWKNAAPEELNDCIGKASHLERKVFLDRLNEEERKLLLAKETLFSERVIYSENVFDESGKTTETFRIEGVLYDIVTNGAMFQDYEIQAQKYHIFAYGSNTGVRSCIKLDTDANENDAIIYCWMKDHSTDYYNSGAYGITFVSGKSAYDFSHCKHGIENCDVTDFSNPVVWRLKVRNVTVSKPEDAVINYNSDLWNKSTFKVTGDTSSGWKAHYWYVYQYQVKPASDEKRKKAYGDGSYHGGFWDLKDASGKKCGNKTITTTVDIGSRDLHADENRSGITYRLPLTVHKNTVSQNVVTDAEATCLNKGYRHTETTYSCAVCDKTWNTRGVPQETPQLAHAYSAKTAVDHGIPNGRYWEECVRSCGGTDVNGAFWQRNIKYLQPIRYWEMNTRGGYDMVCSGIERERDYYEAGAVVPEWKRMPSEEFLMGSVNTFRAPAEAAYLDVYIPRKQYTVQYDGNGAKSGSVKSQKAYCGETFDLRENGFLRAGYEFAGWSETPDGSAINPKSVKNLTLVHNQTVTLYAKWKPGIFKINLDNQGANAGTGTKVVYEWYAKGYYEDFTAKKMFERNKIQVPQKERPDDALLCGFRKQQFMGYYTQKNRKGHPFTDRSGLLLAFINGKEAYKYFDQDSVVYAAWKDMRAVEFSPNLSEKDLEILKKGENGEITEQPVVCPFTRWKKDDESITIGFAEPVIKNKKWKKLYRFLGWSLTPVIGSREDIILDKQNCAYTFTKDEDVTLYAQWDTSFMAAYIGNGQSEGMDFLEEAANLTDSFGFAENTFHKTEQAPTIDTATGKKKQESGEPYTEEVLYRFQGWSMALDQDRQKTQDIYSEKDESQTGHDLMQKAVELAEDGIPEGVTFGAPSSEYGRYPALEDGLIVPGEDMSLDETMPYINFYAVWDRYPQILAADLYLPLSDAREGILTEDYLLNFAEASDWELKSEDNKKGIMKKGTDEKLHTSFHILDYQASDFTEAEGEMSLTITYCAQDSARNITKKRVRVYLVDTSGQECDPGSVRFISEKHLDTLAKDSIWRSGEHAKKLAQTLGNKKIKEEYTEVTPLQKAFGIRPVVKPGSGTWEHVQEVWEFTHEEALNVQKYIEKTGIGKDPSGFLEKFKHCKVM